MRRAASVCLPACLFVRLSVCPRPSACLPACLPACLCKTSLTCILTQTAITARASSRLFYKVIDSRPTDAIGSSFSILAPTQKTVTGLLMLRRPNRVGGVLGFDNGPKEGTRCPMGVFRPSAGGNHHQHWGQPAVLERWSPQVHLPPCPLPDSWRVCSELSHARR